MFARDMFHAVQLFLQELEYCTVL